MFSSKGKLVCLKERLWSWAHTCWVVVIRSNNSFLLLLLLLVLLFSFPLHPFLGRVVQGGELDLKVLFHNIPVYKETDNLCDRLSAGCPASNNFNVDAKQKLPKFTLPVRKVNPIASPRLAATLFLSLFLSNHWDTHTQTCRVNTSWKLPPKTRRRKVWYAWQWTWRLKGQQYFRLLAPFFPFEYF